MQTSAEVINNLLKKRPADSIPVNDGPWPDTLKKWVQQGMPTDDNGAAVNCMEHFGFDMASCGGWINWQAKLNQNEILEETEEWRIERNGSGAAFKNWKNRSGTPQHIDFHMDSRHIWESEYRPHLLGSYKERLGDMELIKNNLGRYKELGKWRYFGSQFIWENLRASLGDENMFMAFLDDPDWIHDFNRVYTDLYKDCFRDIFAEAGTPDGVWIYEDLGYRDRLFCSPQILEELIFPYYKELVDFFHSYKLPVILHSCGFQKPMIPLAIKAGFDGLNPMEVKAGNNIFEYAEQYGDDLCFFGGLDARVLESHDRPLIKKEVNAFINGMRERGARFVYGSDHSLSPVIDYEDFLYSLEVYREKRS